MEGSRADDYHTLFVIDIATRRVEIFGTTRDPNESFALQAARNLLDEDYRFLRNHRALIIDRDAEFTRTFRAMLQRWGVETVLTPPRSPNGNAYAERFAGSIEEECLGSMILFGEASLRRVLRECVEHAGAERPHQGIGNRVQQPRLGPRSTSLGYVECHERLNGLLRHYSASAA